ncbi:MAG: prolipoprotein diacylglyceryl transferase [Lachnospiraceae bacterium]|nr:prolipoprotein diacylglyceryl transferase [Lachnospiraceae bacterium]
MESINIPTYGLLGGTGFFCGLVYLLLRCREKMQRENAVYIYVFSALFAMLGAKILYLLVSAGDIIKAYGNTTNYLGLTVELIRGGFVFYGGLIGALIGINVMTRYYGLVKNDYISILVPCIPLVHAFGRIGCHVVGCCYGAPTHSHFFSVTYQDSIYAPNNVALVPVQLTEAVIEFAIFITLVIIGIRIKEKSLVLYIYLIAYPIARFILEFYRGDEIRGVFAGLSTSQWISLILAAYAGTKLYRSVGKPGVK